MALMHGSGHIYVHNFLWAMEGGKELMEVTLAAVVATLLVSVVKKLAPPFLWCSAGLVAAAGSLPAHQRFIASVVVASYDRILKYGTAPASVTPAVNIANAC
jgi:hypothetical protein